MIYAGKKEDTRLSVILAVILHVIIFLLIFFCLRFELPDPPPAETFAELSMDDIGFTQTGSGNDQGAPPPETNNSETAETPEEAVVDETSDVSTNVQDTPSPNTSPTESAAEKAERQRKEREAKEAQKKADDIKKKILGGGDGDDPDDGDKGNPTGLIEGKGLMKGEGYNASLEGRGMKGKPKFDGKPKKEGRVVVKIDVNKSGVVTNAQIDKVNSNTFESSLWDLALKAARTATFNSDPNAAVSQRGTITFTFKVN